ncbi:hypothetical protein [Sphingomonas zeae]|uniref:Uncharacterized protein n=1 Tax=Sphingomonas zeae TaxID=1646122 RepID=A0A7Y6EFJ3_9SPHN|nr:hypothetical protein [Sphingomonas zeae]MBB4050181.1 hypothetical protein [Sphingomonas zeae]NUU45441.1 hypothetical protein [Sphingomonas zeae]
MMACPLPRPPWRQGQLDGLCGLYAAINALAYVLAPVVTVDRRGAARMFKHGLAHIAEHVPLTTAVRDGIDPDPWVALVTHLAEHVAAKLDVPISVALPFAGNAKAGRDEWLDLARRTIDAGDALLLLLAGEHRHYTMAARLTPRLLGLHDSSGLQHLQLSATGMGSSKRRHRIQAEWTIVLGLRPHRVRERPG